MPGPSEGVEAVEVEQSKKQPEQVKSALKQPAEQKGRVMKRKISWQDFHGKELYTVREFEPSDTEESDDEDVWVENKKCCTIM